MACTGVIEGVFLTVKNTLVCWKRAYGTELTATQKCLKKIENTGLFTQLIRCCTMKYIDSIDAAAVYYCFNELMRCIVLINKKFKIGQPCGDIIRDILSKEDGQHKNLNPKVVTYLQNISQFAEMSQDSNKSKFHKECGYCLDCKNALMLCTRCNSTYYCSKECQEIDWKMHKKICEETSKNVVKSRQIKNNIRVSFVRDNALNILDAAVDVVENTGIKMSDIVLEVDYVVDEETGVVPALADPPQFVIKDINAYFDKGRPYLPYWLKDGKIEHFVIDDIIANLKHRAENLKTDELLCITHLPSTISTMVQPFPFSQLIPKMM